jgi:hypothetical protein
MGSNQSSLTPAADRRGAPRVTVPLDGSCSGQSGFRSVRICDLSVTGCFVESLEPMTPGQRIAIQVQLPTRGTIDLDAAVVYSSPPMGFGVRFVDVPGGVRDALSAEVQDLLDRTSQK